MQAKRIQAKTVSQQVDAQSVVASEDHKPHFVTVWSLDTDKVSLDAYGPIDITDASQMYLPAESLI
jgi:hypothetical protein